MPIAYQKAKGNEQLAAMPHLSLSPCTHEEADSQLFLHAVHASQHGHSKILIRSSDIDVVAIAVHVAQVLQPGLELWVEIGSGQKLTYI